MGIDLNSIKPFSMTTIEAQAWKYISKEQRCVVLKFIEDRIVRAFIK